MTRRKGRGARTCWPPRRAYGRSGRSDSKGHLLTALPRRHPRRRPAARCPPRRPCSPRPSASEPGSRRGGAPVVPPGRRARHRHQPTRRSGARIGIRAAIRARDRARITGVNNAPAHRDHPDRDGRAHGDGASRNAFRHRGVGRKRACCVPVLEPADGHGDAVHLLNAGVHK